MQTPILIAIIIYMLVLVGVGVLLKKRVNSPLDFINAGRKLGLPIATATLFASWFCGGTILGAAGAAYEGGLQATVADPFGAGVVLILAGFLIFRPMRRMGVSTIINFYENKYNKVVGVLASIAQMLTYMGWLGAILVAFGYAMSMVTGLSIVASIILASLIVILYTAMAGMWGVAVNDAIQMVILIVGLLVLFPVIIREVGGWSTFTASVPPDFFDLWPRGGSFQIWMAYVALWLSLGLGCLPEEALIQRATSSKDENTAVWCGYLSGGLYLSVGLIPPLLGMAAALLLPGLEDPEMSVLLLAQEYLPMAGITIFLAALLAALMSSADAAALAPASIIGDNVYRYINPKATDDQVLKVCRLMIPVVIILSAIVAIRVQGVYELMVDAYTLLLVSLVVPLLGGLYWKKANVPGGMSSILVGLAVWVYYYNVPSEFFGEETAGIIGFIASLITFVIVTLLTQKSHPAKELFDLHGNPMNPREMLGLIPPVAKQAEPKVLEDEAS